MGPKTVLTLLKDTYRDWSEHKAQTLAAALAYFTIFSLAPLLIIVIAIAGLVFGQQAASGQIFAQIHGTVGDSAARTIEGMVASANKPTSGLVGMIVGVATLLFGAAGVFGQLKQSLNAIWEAKPKSGGGIMASVKNQFLSFTMVLGIGFLLLVSLVLSAALGAFGGLLNELLPGMGPILRVVNLLLSLGVITLLFAMIFKVLPDVDIAWGDVWLGAFVTALLFTIGKELIGLYIGLSNVGSAYGAAGSLVVLLVWIYYSALILLFGAAFAHVYAKERGSLFLSTAPEKQSEATGVPPSNTEVPTSDLWQQPSRSGAALSGRTAPRSGSTSTTTLGLAVALLASLIGAVVGVTRLRRT